MTKFCTIIQSQKLNHCGPSSLSSALGLLGIEVSQSEVVRVAGKRYWQVASTGLDQHELKNVAARLGVTCRFVALGSKNHGERFIAEIDRHLAKALPALLCVLDADHWVALLARRADGTFVVMDPLEDDKAVEYWSAKRLLAASWCEPEGDPAEYFAILLARADGRPPRWRLTRGFLRLLRQGSEQTATQWYKDLTEIARRSSREVGAGNAVPMAAALHELKQPVLRSVLHWHHPAILTARRGEILELYGTCEAIAEAADIQITESFDRATFVAQLTVLLSIYAQQGEL